MGDVEATSSGQDWRGYRRGAVAGDPVDQYVIPVEDRIITYRGRTTTFITPGRAGTSQRLFAIHNATGSTVLVSVNRIIVDVLQTVAKAVTVLPPHIRLHRFTALPTGGTALTKVPLDTTLTSSASVVCTGDSSADNAGVGTLSGTALAITPNPAVPLASVAGPRVITAAGYEMVDTASFLIGEPDVTLRALEGLAVTLEHSTATTGNPASDRWTAFCDWTEYTRP